MTKANFAKKEIVVEIFVFLLIFKNFILYLDQQQIENHLPKSWLKVSDIILALFCWKKKKINKKASPSVLRRKKAQPTHSRGFQRFNVSRPFSSHPKCQRNYITYPGKSSFQKIRIPFFLPKFLSQKSVFLQLSLFDPANQTKIKE